MGKKIDTEICYLCGKRLLATDVVTRDHVPAQQFYPKQARAGENLIDELLVLPTHATCNESFSSDEEYFRASIGVPAMGTKSGRLLWNDITAGNRLQSALLRKIYEEFDPAPSGIILPSNKVLKRFDKDRVDRVIWKIIRGLFYLHYKSLLPEEHHHHSEATFDDQKPTSILWEGGLSAAPVQRPKDSQIFDYKLIKLESSGRILHAVALLFWDHSMWIVSFHDPSCHCCGYRQNILAIFLQPLANIHD